MKKTEVHNCGLCANRNTCPYYDTFVYCRTLWCYNYLQEELDTHK